jgi:hypothetical protein
MARAGDKSGPDKKRRAALDLMLLTVELALDVMWRWQNVSWRARSAGARRVQRWAQRHGL